MSKTVALQLCHQGNAYPTCIRERDDGRYDVTVSDMEDHEHVVEGIGDHDASLFMLEMLSKALRSIDPD